MAGTILERLSGKKLALLCAILFIFQVICFLIGGLIAPSPTNVQQILATTCIDKNNTFTFDNMDTFIFLRPSKKSNCLYFDLNDFQNDEELNNFSQLHNLTANDIVFVFQIPLPKDRIDLDMSRWFNSMLSLLMIDIEYRKNIQLTAKYIRIEAKLGYRNKEDPFDKWSMIAHSHQDRLLNCHIDSEMKIDGYYYNCSTLPFFELGNVHHDYYLVNLRIPTYPGSMVNSGLGKIKDLWLVEIHQNGGFTRVWFSLKIIWFPVVIALTFWFWNRVKIAVTRGTNFNNNVGVNVKRSSEIYNDSLNDIKEQQPNIQDDRVRGTTLDVRYLNRKKYISGGPSFTRLNNGAALYRPARPISLLEYTILSLAIGISFLNIPVDIFVLWFDMPYMLFYSDIRQGLFYVVLFIFWIIFCGEHLIDEVPRNRLSAYWKYLSGVSAGCLLLFVFELCERGVELKDPFFSIWASESGAKLAVAILALSSICLASYLTLLSYLIFSVFKNISKKKLTLPAMNKTVKLKYEGIIYRFKFLMATTAICAALTVIYFLISHVSENHWKWQDEEGLSSISSSAGKKGRFPTHGLLPNLQYTSAFYTGVYGMWNLYVIAILVLYAPSHKNKPDGLHEEGECLQLNNESGLAYANEDDANDLLDEDGNSIRYSNGYHSTEPTALTTFLTKENID